MLEDEAPQSKPPLYGIVAGGREVPARSGTSFESIDPSTGDAFARVALGDEEDMRWAIAEARSAFDEGPWPRMKGKERAKYLHALADLVKARAEQLAPLESRDAGATIRKVESADIGTVITALRSFAARATEAEEASLPPWSRSTTSVRKEPIGVCGAITPWNFPMPMAAWKVAPAIAAGNTVVLKPATEACLTALELGRLCLEAGLPPGVVNVVPGPGPSAGSELAGSPMVDRIAFTGSTSVGQTVMRAAAGNIKRLTLELGGKSPSVVLDDADLEVAVDGVAWGMFYHQGQVCAAGTRLLLQRSIADVFVERLVERVESLRVGPALDPNSDLGPLISSDQLTAVEGFVEVGKKSGLTLATGGDRAEVPGFPRGFYFKPTVFVNVPSDDVLAQEEIFGPVLVVMTFDGDEEAVQLANDSRYGLAASVWSTSPMRAKGMADKLRAGTVWINDYHALNPEAPFGGYGESGIGREQGSEGFDEYRELKSIHTDLGGGRDRLPWWKLLLAN